MASRNDITGDAIKTKAPSKAYDEGWDRIFGNKMKAFVEANEEVAQKSKAVDHIYEEFMKESSGTIDPLCKICGKELATVRECGWTSCPKWSSYSATNFEET